ncbi:MAG: transcription antitermination factor NusB [Pseudomonadota bacterium]
MPKSHRHSAADRDTAQNQTQAETPGLGARRGALELIERVRKGETLDNALEQSRSFAILEGADRAFARAMASSVLRRRGSIDHILGAYIDRPLPKKAGRVMDILRLAAVQTLVLKTPDHAAVSTAVELAGERRETAAYAKLVNAVARKVAKNGAAALEKVPDRADTPGWMWRGWERAFGPARARAIAQAHHVPAPLDLTVKDLNSLESHRGALDAEVLLEKTLRLSAGGDIADLPGYQDGRWWVQDVAASLPVRLLGDVANKTVFDLCAAPGGKTMQLSAAGARVTAVDISAPRLERVAENLKRTGLSATLVEADILRWSPAEKADAVLLDAPCSASGTIRRHPDLPWLKTEDDVKALTALQANMIDRALTFLKPGGVLVYCVCSLQAEEGERQSAATLKRHGTLTRTPIAADEIGGLQAAITRAGELRTLPSMLNEKGGMDGFFAARFQQSA